MRPLPGTDLLLEGELGRGASGTVFAARERSTGRRLAVKLLARFDRPEHLERFRREGEVVARLDHPGIVRIHTAGECESGPYLVYELVEGARPLDEVLAAVPLTRRVELVRDAARALGHAHARGVVHRDVKPGNLLVDSSGRVRVTDFGVASVRGASRLTRTGALVGTPSHMAPEQLGYPGEVGPWTDVWGLGVVLYQGLTGALPFEAGSLHELMGAVGARDPEPPRALVPDLPPALEAICLRMLERRQAARYSTAGALAEDLDRFLRGEPPLAGAALRRASRGPWVGAAAAAAGLAGLAGVLFAGPRGAPIDVAPATSPAAGPDAPAAVASAAPAAGPLALLPGPWPPDEGPGSAQEHARALSHEARAQLDELGQVVLDQAGQGDAAAMVELSRIYNRGSRVPRSLTRALHWLFHAVQRDHPGGLNELGDRYSIGEGVPKDLDLAVRCWRRSAEQDDSSGLFRLGNALAQGLGVERDRDRAIELLERALALGSEGKSWPPEARSLLAQLLEERRGPGDVARAAEHVSALRAWPDPDDRALALVEYLLSTRDLDTGAARAEARALLDSLVDHRPAWAHWARFSRLRAQLGD